MELKNLWKNNFRIAMLLTIGYAGFMSIIMLIFNLLCKINFMSYMWTILGFTALLAVILFIIEHN